MIKKVDNIDFLIAGIQKSGTTYLDSLIREHKSISMLNRSMDYSYFDNDTIYENGKEWYIKLFNSVESNVLIGQTSADCAFDKLAIQRIMDFNPKMKLIFILRHPIDRCYSHYWHQIKMGREHLSFRDAINREPSRTKKSLYKLKKYSYLGRSKYESQFQNIFNHIPKEQVLLIPFELFTKDELKWVNIILSFLSLEKINSIDELMTSQDKSTNPSRLPPLVLQRLSFLFRWSKLTRFLYGKSLKVKRPPKINKVDEDFLNIELKGDIEFYNSVKESFVQ